MSGSATVRSMRFHATTVAEAKRWQADARAKLFALMMGGAEPARVPLEPKVLSGAEVAPGGFSLVELTLQTLPDRRAHVWIAIPHQPKGAPPRKLPAVLALHGHGGTGEEVVKGRSLYWYGRALAEMGYIVISPDIGSHDLQHPNWTLMGERTWDALRCVDYLLTRDEVDPERIAVCGLSLGGETTMYVAALDERLKAVDSAGWLTTVANMKNGHCPCWNSPGLEEHFDFSDIFACVAPRPLVFELGKQERAPGGFPVEIGTAAFAEVTAAYKVFGAEANAVLDVHPGGHVFVGKTFWQPLGETCGVPYPWVNASPSQHAATDDPTGECLRRGEIARRAFARALGVLESWWAIRDPETDLTPRQVTERVWAPNDNAADMLPFLYLTAHFVAPERKADLDRIFASEARLTNRVGPLPDWYSLTDHKFVHPQPDMGRIIFGASEYCKDGLIPMTEVMGRGHWTDRMLELIEAIFEHATFATAYGPLPADNAEVNGNMLQVLGRVYFMTGDRRYLDWAERIGDAYCLEVLPRSNWLPVHRWDFTTHKPIIDSLNMNDHGNEIIGGLVELAIASDGARSPKAAQYREAVGRMIRCLLDKGRNPDGLWWGVLCPSTLEVTSHGTPDTWGYALGGVSAFGKLTHAKAMEDAARVALRSIDQAPYYQWEGADSYADSIEGGLLLLNRYPEPAAIHWLERCVPLFLARQQDSGIVEGWYGDGNYARTALMIALRYTEGAWCLPWRPDLRYGAQREGNGVRIAVQADAPWEGSQHLDIPRHRVYLHLPFDYARLNQFPEWFTVEPEKTYRVRVNGQEARKVSGKALAEGLPVRVGAGKVTVVEVQL